MTDSMSSRDMEANSPEASTLESRFWSRDLSPAHDVGILLTLTLLSASTNDSGGMDCNVV